MNRGPILLAALSVASLVAFPAAAQRGGTGGFGGGMGMGGMSMGGMGSGFSSGLGMNSGTGMGSGMGMGMSSGMGMGGMGGGMGGFGTGMGSGFGQGGFGQSGMNNMQNGQQGFVGRDSSDMTQIFRQMGRSSNQFFQQLNRTMGRGRGRRNSSQEENAAPPVRVRLEVAFDTPPIQPTVMAANVEARLASTLSRRSITAPEVEMNGDTVVLRGTAQSESQRMVIEQLVLMEPGVFAVDNQMTVAPSAEERPSESPPSAPAPSK